MSAQPSFVRFLICCPFGQHRPMECECCGVVSCLDCCTDLTESQRSDQVDA